MQRNRHEVMIRRKRIVGMIIVIACLLMVTGTAWAAELAPDAGAVYRLEKGQVIQDDLYVSAGEIFIDGTVEGDLVATGGYVEVNGVVTGDALVAGASIVINGVVQDDVRAGGAAIDIVGTVGGDLLAAAGGNQGFTFPFNVSGRSITPGLRIVEGATIGQDALIGAGSATIDGAIGRNLYVGAGELILNGEVMGDAWLYVTTLTVSDAATVEGTLHYPSDATVTIPPTVATQVIVAPAGSDVDAATDATVAPVSTSSAVFKWLLSTVLLLVGFALLGWLLMQFSPGMLVAPTNAIAANPAMAFIVGLVTFLLMIPVSALLVALFAVFWGFFPAGLAMLFFLFGLLSLIWVFSPMAPGLWLGRAISRRRWGDLPALLVGMLAIALLARLVAWVPCTGALVAFFIYLICFSFTAGGFYLVRRQRVAAIGEDVVGS